MATHSSILAWRILWPGEPGGLQSTGSQNSDATEVTSHDMTLRTSALVRNLMASKGWVSSLTCEIISE